MEKNQQELRSHRCCFTGHRPQYLKRPLEEIQADLEKAIHKVVSEGYTTFITGMSQGADIIAGEIVCRLKADDPRLKYSGCMSALRLLEGSDETAAFRTVLPDGAVLSCCGPGEALPERAEIWPAEELRKLYGL